MKYRNALVRSFRTLLQGVAGAFLAFLLSIKGEGTFVNIKAKGAVLAFGLFVAACTAVLTLIQNLAEDSTDLNVPK